MKDIILQNCSINVHCSLFIIELRMFINFFPSSFFFWINMNKVIRNEKKDYIKLFYSLKCYSYEVLLLPTFTFLKLI